MKTFTYDSGTIRAAATPAYPIERNPFLYLHSAANTPREFFGAHLLPSLRPRTRAFVGQGFSIVTPLAASTYGNDAGLTESEAAIAAHRSAWKGTAGPTGVAASSMGVINAIRLALDGDEEIAFIIGWNPVIDLVSIYEGDLGDSRSVLATAHGVTFPTPLPAYADFVGRAGELSEIPMLFYHSSDDPFNVGFPEFAAASGATFVDVGALGHDDDPVAASPIEDLLEFVANSLQV